VAALQLLAIMIREGRPLSELAAGAMSRVPQVLEGVTLKVRRPLESMSRLSKAMTAVEAELGAEGRLLVRWSGTEPKLRVMVEGPDDLRIRQMAKDLCAAAVSDMAD
jgi:phosphoglucosamine mutase